MTTAAQTAASERLPLRTKLAFGAGGAAETIAIFSLSQYALLYYNQVLGMNAGLASLAIAISLLFDGFVDPLVGSISDRTRHRLGRRHPYMFAAPIPIALCFVAIFNPPGGLSEMMLFAWLCVTVIGLRVCMAFFHTPHLALGGELSHSYTERSQVMAWNNFFIWAGGSSITYIALTFFFHATPEYPRGLLNPAPYLPFAIFAAASTMVILFASAWFTRRQIPNLPKPPADQPKFSPYEFLKDIGKIMRNRNYVWLLVAYLFNSLMIGLRGAISLYMATFFWGFTSEQVRLYIVGSFVGYIVALLFSGRMHGKFNKRPVIIWSAIASAVFPAVAVMLRLGGFMFENGDPLLLPTLVALSSVSYGAGAILNISVMSALADIADENEVRFGVRQEGVLYATRALFAKVDQALGTALAGLALTVIAFPENAQPGQVDATTLTHLAWFDGPIAMIPGLIAVYFYARFNISKQSHAATLEKIQAIRAGRAQPGSIPDVPGGGIAAAPTPSSPSP